MAEPDPVDQWKEVLAEARELARQRLQVTGVAVVGLMAHMYFIDENGMHPDRGGALTTLVVIGASLLGWYIVIGRRLYGLYKSATALETALFSKNPGVQPCVGTGSARSEIWRTIIAVAVMFFLLLSDGKSIRKAKEPSPAAPSSVGPAR